MDFKYHITRVSGNRKTGPIPVTTTSSNSCPSTCPYIENGCYAKSGPLRLHWGKVDNGERGMDLEPFLKEIKALPKGSLWRHNQAGDLPHENGVIDHDGVMALVKANKRKNGFTYTHHDMKKRHNFATVKSANDNGFTVNVSGNNVSHAVAMFKEYGLPTVTVLPMDAPNDQTVEGVRVVACPAEKSDRVICASCALCQVRDRKYIIGFRAHGTSKKKANIIAVG